MTALNKSTFIAGGTFVLSFAILLVMMVRKGGQQSAPPKESMQIAAVSGNSPTAPAGPTAEIPEIPPKAPAPPQARPLVLAQLALPEDKPSQGKEELEEGAIRDLYFDRTGTKLIAVSDRDTHCLDVATGQSLQVYRTDARSQVAHHPFIAVSPDGRFVAVPHEEHKELVLQEADTGKTIAKYRADDRTHLGFTLLPIAFTPGGEFAVTMVGHDGPAYLAVSTRTGTGRLLAIPDWKGKAELHSFLVPLPAQATLIRGGVLKTKGETSSSGIRALNLTTGADRPISGVTVKPETWQGDRPLVASPDGKWLLAKNRDTIQVCDWQVNRLVFDRTREGDVYRGPRFTPDGQRFLIIWIQDTFQPEKFGTIDKPSADSVMLFDVASGKRLGDFTPPDSKHNQLTAVAMSQDGKTLAVAAGRLVSVLDFQEAFKIAPLPPVSRPAEPEQLP